MDDAGTSELEAFKVVLLGEGAVGKSSILLRYMENKFNQKHLSTTQVVKIIPLKIISVFLGFIYVSETNSRWQDY